MGNEERVYRTGQGIPVSAEYMCQSGEVRKFTKDDVFPVCPVSGEDTYWEHHEEEEKKNR